MAMAMAMATVAKKRGENVTLVAFWRLEVQVYLLLPCDMSLDIEDERLSVDCHQRLYALHKDHYNRFLRAKGARQSALLSLVSWREKKICISFTLTMRMCFQSPTRIAFIRKCLPPRFPVPACGAAPRILWATRAATSNSFPVSNCWLLQVRRHDNEWKTRANSWFGVHRTSCTNICTKESSLGHAQISI